MTATVTEVPKLSVFTLAALEDSGWYKVNYSNADSIYFGEGNGCDFLSKTCIDPSTKQPRFPEFCSLDYERTCSFDHLRTGYCIALPREHLLPQFDYFGNGLAGWDLFSDGCPTPVSKPGSDCTDPLAKSQGKLGPQSRCFEVLEGLSARTRDCICIEHEVRILKN